MDFRGKRRGIRIQGGIIDKCPACGELGLMKVMAKVVNCTHETTIRGGVEYVESHHTIPHEQLVDLLPRTRQFLQPRLKEDPELPSWDW